MSGTLLTFTLVWTALTLGAGAQSDATAKRIAVIIDVGKTGVPISPYIYGQFIEHIGDLINRSLWAEMLDDRITELPVMEAPNRVAIAAISINIYEFERR